MSLFRSAFRHHQCAFIPTGTSSSLSLSSQGNDNSSSTATIPDCLLENDLVAIKTSQRINPIFCVVTPENQIHPLCTHEDDVETDLFLDPRETPWEVDDAVNVNDNNNDDDGAVVIVGYYGEGWYGQRPVPSLGGGPGYGAEAIGVWSVEEELLRIVREVDGVEVPVLDVGISHGEKARSGAF